jgi:hypothetical protein
MALTTSCSAKALVNVYVFIWSLRSLKQNFQNYHYKTLGKQEKIPDVWRKHVINFTIWEEKAEFHL